MFSLIDEIEVTLSLSFLLDVKVKLALRLELFFLLCGRSSFLCVVPLYARFFVAPRKITN